MLLAADVLAAFFGEQMDRRRFLKGGVGGLTLLGSGCLLPAGCKTYPKPDISLQFFNAREYAILNTVAERLFGTEGHVGSKEGQIDVAASIDAAVAHWEADAQAQLRIMLRVFEHGTYLFDLQRKRFTRLSAKRQDQYLAGWMNSTLGARRIVFRALKALAAMGYYQHPRTWQRLQYEGPWLGRVEATTRIAFEAPMPVGALTPAAR